MERKAGHKAIEKLINAGITTLTSLFGLDRPDKNGRIYTKKAVENIAKSIKRDSPILTETGECVGKILSEPEITLLDGEPRFISISVTALINDYSKLKNGVLIDTNIKAQNAICP